MTIAALISLPSFAQDESSAGINCLDTVTGTVTRRAANRCPGRIVNDDEAGRIEQARVDRIHRAVKGVPKPVDPALRQVSAGTGFYITKDSWILTNNHVVGTCKAVSIETAGGLSEEATVAFTDPDDDLALVKARTPSPAVAVFHANVSATGQNVMAMGYPNLGLQAITPQTAIGTLTGPINPDGRRITFHADIRPGNSGGPLLDQEGLVVGVVFAKVNTVSVYETTGRTVRNVGFAITVPTVIRFLAAHDVHPQLTANAEPLDGQDMLNRAQQFLARLLCWN